MSNISSISIDNGQPRNRSSTKTCPMVVPTFHNEDFGIYEMCEGNIIIHCFRHDCLEKCVLEQEGQCRYLKST